MFSPSPGFPPTSLARCHQMSRREDSICANCTLEETAALRIPGAVVRAG